LFVAIVGSVLLAALWLPSLAVLFFGGRRPLVHAMRKIGMLWLAQAMAAAALIYLADAVGLANPVGYSLAICMAIGCAGALALGYAMRGGRAREVRPR